MKRRLTYLVVGLVVAVSAAASSGLAARGSGELTYVFNGRLLADAGSSSSLYVEVRGGSKPALRKLVGAAAAQHFAVGQNTQYLRWSRGVPTVVQESNLVVGDVVSIRVRAARDASLAQIESTPASRVADRGATPGHAVRPLWLFVGTLDAPASNGRLAIRV